MKGPRPHQRCFFVLRGFIQTQNAKTYTCTSIFIDLLLVSVGRILVLAYKFKCIKHIFILWLLTFKGCLKFNVFKLLPIVYLLKVTHGSLFFFNISKY